MGKAETLVVEFGDDHCRDIFIAPLDRRFRGRFEAQQIAKHDRDAGALLADWPDPIAGQQIEIDLDSGAAAVLEPLHEFPAIAQRLKSRGMSLAPARESVACDLPTLLYYVRAAVAAKQARIVRGTIPEIDESKVRRDLFVAQSEPTTMALAKALNAQAAAFTRLADVLERALAKR